MESELRKIIENFYDNNCFIPLSKQKYLENIEELIKNNPSENTDLLIKNYTLNLIMNGKYYLNFIDNYINTNFSYTFNNKEILKYFKDLNNLYSVHKEQIDLNKLILLLNNNKLLYFLVEVIFKKYKNSIINNRFNDSFDCDVLIYLIDAYCIINNIEINTCDNLNYEFLDEADYSTDSLTTYLNEIRKYEVLSREEEKDLIIKAQKGDELARNKFILCNLRLVASIVLKHYRNRELSELDLIQEGNIGVIKAIDKFDVKTNYKFSTFAYFLIKQQIDIALLTKGRNIHIPVYMHEKMKNYRRCINEFELTNKRMPTFEEIVELTGYDEETIIIIKKYLNDTISYDIKLGESEDISILDNISDEENNFETIIDSILDKAIIDDTIKNAGLTIREKDIIKRRYGFYGNVETLETVGKTYGLTKERIRTIERSALKKIRVYFHKKNIVLETNDTKNNITKTLYDYLTNYTPDQIDYVLNILDEESKNILSLKYGEDLKHPIKRKLTAIQDKKFYNKVLPRLTKLLETFYPSNKLKNDIVSPDTCDMLLHLFKTYPFNQLQQEIPYETILVGLLKIGYIDNIRYSDKAIAKFLNINPNNISMIYLEFRKLVTQNKLLKDIYSNRRNYLDIVNAKLSK